MEKETETVLANKVKIAVICGPTATGKTKLAVEIAKKLNGEIICADSMQIYKGLDIGTAKATEQEMCEIPHHIVDFLSPEVVFSVADFVKLAHQFIKEISDKGKLPIIVGGTGLYISSLVNGITFTEENTDLTVRTKLMEELAIVGGNEMYSRLCKIDPLYAQKVEPNNTKRVIRALELFMQTGITMTQQQINSKPLEKPYNAKIINLNFEDRKMLYSQINKRVEEMVKNGVLDEAEYVYKNKENFLTAAQAIGYKEFFDYFDKKSTLEQCTQNLQQATRRYAKRQMTWFNRMENANILFQTGDENVLKKALEIINS